MRSCHLGRFKVGPAAYLNLAGGTLNYRGDGGRLPGAMRRSYGAGMKRFCPAASLRGGEVQMNNRTSRDQEFGRAVDDRSNALGVGAKTLEVRQ